MKKIINIVGCGSNVGKTQLITKLISQLVNYGVTVGTIKHDVHGFDIDKPNKDSYKHRQAGSSCVAISSKNRFALIKELEEEMNLEDIIKMMWDKQIILIEGYKQCNYPKIEVFREGFSDKIISKDDLLMAIVSDDMVDTEKPLFSTNQIKELADFILKI